MGGPPEEAILRPSQAEHLLHVVERGWTPEDPCGRTQRPAGEVVPRGGAVGELEALAGTDEQRRVLPWVVAAPQCNHPDRARHAGSRLALSREHQLLLAGGAAPLGDRLGDAKGGPARRVDLRPMVQL